MSHADPLANLFLRVDKLEENEEILLALVEYLRKYKEN
ncbi:hypothetical protein [Caudoviricetes sp.]|nr:hypothetical protein [Caudoviricetes sp.]